VEISGSGDRTTVTAMSREAALWCLRAFVNRWSGVQISHPAPQTPNNIGLPAEHDEHAAHQAHESTFRVPTRVPTVAVRFGARC
jgi:hypothetical protein